MPPRKLPASRPANPQAPTGAHPVPYPDDDDVREYFERNSHPVPYAEGEQPEHRDEGEGASS